MAKVSHFRTEAAILCSTQSVWRDGDNGYMCTTLHVPDLVVPPSVRRSSDNGYIVCPTPHLHDAVMQRDGEDSYMMYPTFHVPDAVMPAQFHIVASIQPFLSV